MENPPKSTLAVSTGTEHAGTAQGCKAHESLPASKSHEKVSSGMQDKQGGQPPLPATQFCNPPSGTRAQPPGYSGYPRSYAPGNHSALYPAD